MSSNPLVPLGFERLCAVILPLSPNSDDVVLVSTVEVDLLFVAEMLQFFVD